MPVTARQTPSVTLPTRRCTGFAAGALGIAGTPGTGVTSDPLSLEGIGDPSAKYAAAAVNSCLNIVFNGIWSRQTDYFTAPNGVITLTGYGTAEGTQKYKIALWRKVDGGAQYVDGSTYYIKTDGQNYRCSIGGLDPAASYRITISYDSSRYYLYGGMKVEGIAG